MYTDLLSHIATLYHDTGDTEKSFHYNSLEVAAISSAFEQQRQTLARARSATSDGIVQQSISDLYGNLQVRLNEPLAAISSYDDAIAAARAGKDVETEVYSHAGRANALIDAGRLDDVRTELTAITELAKGREIQYRRPLRRAAIVEAKLLFAQGRLNEARRKIDAILGELRAPNTGSVGYLGLALSLATRISLADHRYADAESTAAEALGLFEKRARNPAASADVGESLLLLARAQAGLGRSVAAAANAGRAATALKAGLGPEHPFTLEATTLLGASP